MRAREELLYNLPDYVTGTLDDTDMKSEIETAIQIDAEFRKEYESMKSALNFASSVSLEEPHPSYFNNMIPVLNARIEKENSFQRHSANIFSLWKIMIPTAIAAAILIIFLFKGNEVENILPQNETAKTQEVKTEQRQTPPVITDNNAPDKNTENVKVNPVTQNKNKRTIKTKENNYKSESRQAENLISYNSMIELSEADSETEEVRDVFYEEETEFEVQDEFESLTTEEKEDVLMALKDAKI